MQAAGAVSLSAAALSLIGCSGDDDSASTGSTSPSAAGTSPTLSTGSSASTGPTGAAGTGSTGISSSGLLSEPVDTTDKAVAGGTLRDFQNADMLHFDILAVSNNPVINFSAVFAYPRLLKFRSGKYPDARQATLDGEVFV